MTKLTAAFRNFANASKKMQQAVLNFTCLWVMKYRVSIKSFPYYKHLLQENYVE